MRRLLTASFLVLAATASVTLSGNVAVAQGFSLKITVDENGHGTLTNTNGFFSTLPNVLQADPGPGGLSSALTYGLINPPGLTPGDLVIQELAGGAISDFIRFNPQETISGTTGALVFYSDNADGVDALADTGFPTLLSANVVRVVEVGPEAGPNGFTYTPTSGQPGFVSGAGGPVTYVIQSDPAPAPEPAALALLSVGLVGLGLARRRRS